MDVLDALNIVSIYSLIPTLVINLIFVQLSLFQKSIYQD